MGAAWARHAMCEFALNSLEKNYITRTSFGSFSYAVSDVDVGNGMIDDE